MTSRLVIRFSDHYATAAPRSLGIESLQCSNPNFASEEYAKEFPVKLQEKICEAPFKKHVMNQVTEWDRNCHRWKLEIMQMMAL